MKKPSIPQSAALTVSQRCALAFVGRHITLSQDPKAAPGLVRFLSQAVQLADGTTQSWVTLTRTGNFNDPRYGDFSITPAMLDQMVDNFDKRVLGQDVFLDVNHAPGEGAAAKVLKLSVESGRLRALVAWTPFGVDAVKTKGFTYLSAEYHETWTDNEGRAEHGCVLLGAGLTNRPVIKKLDPIQLSEAEHDHDAPARVAISPQLLKELQEQDVNFLEQLKAKYLAQGLPEAVITKLLAEAKKQIDAAGTDQAKCLSVVDIWVASGQAVADQIKSLSAAGGPVNITLAAPGSVD